jgi:non-ribosomal peptide synthetase component E (peptide arylation enzyme)/peptidoglycan/LPS O-acetylase OafA/YrhL
VTVVDARPLPTHLLRGGAPDAVALIVDGEALTYSELATRVAERAAELRLGSRSLVVLAGSPGVGLVTTYLALLEDGHVPLLAGDHPDRLADAWSPAAVVVASSNDVAVDHLRTEERDLHPDLALLLSTSGSTGAPKLVRLSHGNLVSNARAIADYLGLTSADRGITSLPLHYCYGLSVLHSHLVVGGSVVLTGTSVVDPCFAAALHDHGVTNLAGVPHTFELLERSGPERIHSPSLRLLTQAGGRMAPDEVARWRDRAESWGANLVVMYGQTEAAARMAYLPPSLARVCPEAIGVPIPGGALEVRPLEAGEGGAATLDDGVGELVYTGPNVMMGYATGDDDLADGHTLTELRTGDLGRFDPEHGVFEVVGRRSRFVKPFGLRIDLDAVEALLATDGFDVALAGDDEMVVAGAPAGDVMDVAARVQAATGLPASMVAVVPGPLPRTTSGKVDYRALRRAAAGRADERAVPRAAPGDVDALDGAVAESPVGAVYAAVLGHRVSASSTFVSAGGDSLSYVECSLRLERVLGRLPEDWHLRTVAELEAPAHPSTRTPRIDTTMVLRAIGICAVVSTHVRILYFPGGAHLLLAVVGFNFSRFQLAIDGPGDRVRSGLRSIARVAVPLVLWTAVALAVSDSYGWTTLALVNNYLGPDGHAHGYWHFWFIEAFVQICLLTTVLLAVPPVRRMDRRYPYLVPVVVLLAAVQLRAIDVAGLGDPANLRFRTHGVAWFFVLGWLIHRSTTWWQRALTSALCVATVANFFGRPQREVFIVAGLLALTWCRQVPWPRPLATVVATLAAASMWIYISHFQLWHPLERLMPRGLAYVATLAAGVAIWALAERLSRAARRARSTDRPPPMPSLRCA